MHRHLVASDRVERGSADRLHRGSAGNLDRTRCGAALNDLAASDGAFGGESDGLARVELGNVGA